MKKQLCLALVFIVIAACVSQSIDNQSSSSEQVYKKVSRLEYQNRLEGFWLGQSIANWTGLVTEMDKIGGEGIHGQFYTREDWGKPDQPSIWGQGIPSDLSANIDWVFVENNKPWGSDDDTDIEYMYQYLLNQYKAVYLTPEQIRDGWLTHIYSDENTPFTDGDGKPENYLWVSNQKAHDLMREGMMPPQTSDPKNNEHFEMIDAQLTTEIFGLYAPTRPDIALDMAKLPISVTARDDAAWAAQFYVVMYSLAIDLDTSKPLAKQILKHADIARSQLPDGSYSAAMYDFVKAQYLANTPWEKTRDQLYQRYQVEQQDGYDISSKQLYCNGCFASGINFGASIISLLYGEGDFKETVKIAALAGWDSDNPAATWGGMLGFMLGRNGIEQAFDRKFSTQFNIHRTRGGFPNQGIDDFDAMASVGVSIVDRVVTDALGGKIEGNSWHIPLPKE